MYPVLFRIGDIAISSFSVMLLVSFTVGYLLSSPEFRRRGLQDELRDFILLAIVFGGVFGAKILFLLENATLSEFMADPARFLASGLTYLGGFLGSVFLIWLVTLWKKVSFLKVADTISPIIVLCYAVGRVGCLLVGDDYGIATSLPWGMSFPEGSPPTNEIVHPTQLYDMIVLTSIFIGLWRLRKRETPAGWLMGVTLIALGLERLLIEFIRTTTPSFIPGLSVAQIMSLGLALAGALLIAYVSFGIRVEKPSGQRVKPS